MKRILHRFSICLVLAVGCAERAGAALAAPVRWVIAQRDLDFGAWRGRIAMHGDDAWIGGGPSSETSPGNLYRFDGESWQLAPPVGLAGARTFVLAFDPAGRLWVAPYVPNAETAYAHLELRRWDNGGWHRETLTPGIWPQAMAWPSTEEGWIAGNHGMFYHRTGGRWRIETLDLPTEERRNRNVLALRMTSPESGWAVGSRGLVATYRQGRWRRLPVPSSFAEETLEALDVTPDGRLWVAGYHGTLAMHDGRSGRWWRWHVPPEVDLLGLEMLDDGRGWAVGSNGAILYFDGRTWRRQPSPTQAGLADVRMTEQGTGWVAGRSMLLRAETQPAPRFADVSDRSPALTSRGAGQLAAVDADLDGDLDLFVVERGAIFENRNGQLIDGSHLLSPPGDVAIPGVAWGDADGDGHLDLVAVGRRSLTTWFYRQRGRLAFDSPVALPVGPLGGWLDVPSLIDLNGDGALDLHLARSSTRPLPAMPDRIYFGDGAGSWNRRPETPGDRGAERLVLWGDVDGDLDLDLFLGSNGLDLDLWRNDRGRLRRATRDAGLALPEDAGEMSLGAFWDLDRDGDLDLLVLGRRLFAFENDGRGHFRTVSGWFDPLPGSAASEEAQVAIGDLDHDGFAEILLSTGLGARARLALYSRDATGLYRDRAAAAGVRDLAGRSALFCDLDGDGDLDLVTGGDRSSHRLVNLQDDQSFLKVRARDSGGDPLARGAQVRVYDAGRLGEPAALRGFQAVGVGLPGTGVTHLSEVHFGVPPGRTFDLEVRFLGGRRVVTRGVVAGSVVTVHELPWGLRSLALAARRTVRAFRRADLGREAAAFAAVIALTFAVRGPLSRRFQAEILCPRAPIPILLVAAHLAGAVIWIDATDGWRRAAPFATAPALALGLLSADRAITHRLRLRRARHLGPYRLLEPLGEGGMGAVWRARHLVSGRRIALKLLHPRITAEETHRRRLLREGAILAQLDHPNIVRVYETGEIGGQGFVSMEILDGRPLRAALAPAERSSAAALPSPASLAAFLAVAAEALGAVANRGIVHRDVKTDNFFVLGSAPLPADLSGWRERLKLMDFGLASGRDLPTLTGDHALLGTLAYLAPEVLRGEPADIRSDLYSLGVVAFELALGRLPRADDLSAPAPTLPPELAHWIRRLLSADPAQRPSSAGEVARAAAAIAAGEPPGLEIAVDSMAAPMVQPPEAESGWRVRLAEARRHQREGRAVEAHILMLELLAELRGTLERLPAAKRTAYAQKVRLDELIDLERTLRPGDR